MFDYSNRYVQLLAEIRNLLWAILIAIVLSVCVLSPHGAVVPVILFMGWAAVCALWHVAQWNYANAMRERQEDAS